MKNKQIIIIILLLILTLVVTLLYIFLNTYKIKYINGDSYYDIILKHNTVIVKSDTPVMCITDPCPNVKNTNTLRFSEKNQKKVIDFIKRLSKKYKNKNITSEQLNESELIIMESIIYNEEELLKPEEISENAYIVETDMKLKTTLNDGGSYTSIYYIIDFDNKKVIKKEEHYYAPKNKTEEITLYKKTIDDELTKKAKKVLTEAISNIAKIDTEYNYYTIKYNNSKSYIRSKESIEKIEEVLIDMDYY